VVHIVTTGLQSVKSLFIYTSQLMLHREMIAVCSQINTKHINTLCGQNVELLNVKLVVHIVTTGLQSVKSLFIYTSQLMLHREMIAVCSQIQTKHINTLCGQNEELLHVQLVVHIVTSGLQRVKSLFIKTSQLMLHREMIAVCSQIHTKHINTVCGQNVELLNVKLVVHIVTTGLQSVKSLFIKTSQLILYRKIIAVCSQIHTKHINTVCGQNEEMLHVQLVVHIVNTGFWRVKIHELLTPFSSGA